MRAGIDRAHRIHKRQFSFGPSQRRAWSLKQLRGPGFPLSLKLRSELPNGLFSRTASAPEPPVRPTDFRVSFLIDI
jgi:hypothetical protein